MPSLHRCLSDMQHLLCFFLVVPPPLPLSFSLSVFLFLSSFILFIHLSEYISIYFLCTLPFLFLSLSLFPPGAQLNFNFIKTAKRKKIDHEIFNMVLLFLFVLLLLLCCLLGFACLFVRLFVRSFARSFVGSFGVFFSFV